MSRVGSLASYRIEREYQCRELVRAAVAQLAAEPTAWPHVRLLLGKAYRAAADCARLTTQLQRALDEREAERQP